jgi:hypothetical protein
VIIRNDGELVDEPGHEVDADHRDLALGGDGEERAPALRVSVEDGDAQVPQERPRRDLLRPHRRRDQLRRDDERMPAVPVADQLGSCCERSRALARAERSDEDGGIALEQKRCGAFLVAAQDAGEGCIHLSFRCVYQ